MSIARFEEFLVLAGHLNYTQAARRLNITQSSLSKHVLALEKEFGVTLIDRDKQQIELTREGRIFCEEATRIIDTYRCAQRRLHETHREICVAGTIKDSAIRALITRVTEELHEDEPLGICTRECSSSALHEELEQGRIDVGIEVADPFEEPAHDIRSEPLASVPLIAVTKIGTALAQRETVSIQDLAHEHIMHPTGSSDMQRGANAIEAIFQAHGVTMGKRIFFATSWSDFPTAQLECNVFVMPRSLFSKQLFGQALAGCAGIPISDADARFPYQVSWRADEKNPAIARYVEALKKAAKHIEERD